MGQQKLSVAFDSKWGWFIFINILLIIKLFFRVIILLWHIGNIHGSLPSHGGGWWGGLGYVVSRGRRLGYVVAWCAMVHVLG